MLKQYVFMIFLCLIISICKAQILTIDKTDTVAYQKKKLLQGSLSIGFEADKQKNLLFDGTNLLDVQYSHFKELLILAGSYRFTYNNGEDFLNSGFIHLRWRHGYKNKWQPESFIQYQWDNARGLLHRFVGGENLRLNYWHKNNWEISLATGLMYENEIWNYVAVDSILIPMNHEHQHTNLLKSNNYIRWEGKITKMSTLSCVIFYQAPFYAFIDQFRIASNVKLEIPIAKHFDFGISFNSMYDAKPIVPIPHFYYNYSNSILYKF